MGVGIAQVFAQHNYPVILFDVNAQALEKAKNILSKNLDFWWRKEKFLPKKNEYIQSSYV